MKRETVRFFGGIALALPMASLLCYASQVFSEDTIGRMGTSEIKSSEMSKIFAARAIDGKAQVSIDALDKLIRDELLRRVILHEARTSGLDKKSEVLARLERAREDALIAIFVNEKAKPSEDYPSEDEIKEAYESNRGAFLIPKQYRVAQIYLLVGEGDSADKVEARAKEIAAKAAEKNADFGKIALDSSHHRESAVRGGDLGWLGDNQLMPEVRQVIQGMTKGAISKPIRSASGYHIIKLLDSKDASERPFSELRTQISESLRQRRLESNSKQYMSELMKKSPITVNQVELSKYAQPGKP